MSPVSDTDRPLVTVVTASLNALAELQRTVDSVASQTFRSVEHVVVDGGSDDGTRQYLEGLGERVRWVSEPDDGIADALNKGVAMARGEYIIVLQAGDRFASPASLAHAAEHLSARPDLLSFCVLMEEGSRHRLFPTHGFGLRAYLHATIPHQGLLASRALFARIGGFDPSFRIAMDYDWLLRAQTVGASIIVDDRVLALMPATGISSRLDWVDVHRRLLENRRTQFANAKGWGSRAALHLYWALYPSFKRARSAVQRLSPR